MNKIDEATIDFEYSSGWKKMIKDTRSDKINEEFRLKVEDLQKKLEELNSSITNLAKNEINDTALENAEAVEMKIKQRLDKFEANFMQVQDEIKNMQSELIQYKNILESQNYILSNIMDILRTNEENDKAFQKGFISNIFKKK